MIPRQVEVLRFQGQRAMKSNINNCTAYIYRSTGTAQTVDEVTTIKRKSLTTRNEDI